ncbi:MAG: PHP domain-containing protein [Desulfobacterales bacterium]|nr:PHP domain-containing protein [Desulfobacterales bacterium]
MPKFNDHETRGYLCIDMHCHSRYSSDGIASVKAILKKASNLGIGVAITDHNTIVGSQEALELSGGRVVVIPGIEVTTKERKDLIIYFYSPGEMIDFYNDYIRKRRTRRVVNRTNLELKQMIEAARQYRVFIGAPHPHGLAYKNLYKYLKRKKRESIISSLDGIEGVNARLTRAGNLKAIDLAASFNKPIFGGSDAHSVARIGHVLTCSRARNYEEFLDNLAVGDSFIVGRKNQIYASLGENTASKSGFMDQFRQGLRKRKNRAA